MLSKLPATPSTQKTSLSVCFYPVESIMTSDNKSHFEYLDVENFAGNNEKGFQKVWNVQDWSIAISMWVTLSGICGIIINWKPKTKGYFQKIINLTILTKGDDFNTGKTKSSKDLKIVYRY